MKTLLTLKPYFPFLQGNDHSGVIKEFPLFTLVDDRGKEAFPGELFFSGLQVIPNGRFLIAKFYMGAFVPNQMIDAPPLYGFYLIDLTKLHKRVLCVGHDSKYSCSVEVVDHKLLIKQNLPKEIVRTSEGVGRYSLDTLQISKTCEVEDFLAFPLLEISSENVRQFNQMHPVLWERLQSLPRSDAHSLLGEVSAKDQPPLYLYSVGDFLIFKESPATSFFVIRWQLLKSGA